MFTGQAGSWKASVPPLHRSYLGDATVGSKDHVERNVHGRHVDVHAMGTPAIAVMQLRLQVLHGLRFGQSQVAMYYSIVDPVSFIPVQADAHRGATVTGGIVVGRFGG